MEILIVEDSPTVAATLQKELQRFPTWKTSHVATFQECLDRNDEFDVVLLDLELPDSDSEHTLKRAGEIDPPVILVSSNLPSDIRAAVPKPVNPHVLVNLIMEIEQRQQDKQISGLIREIEQGAGAIGS